MPRPVRIPIYGKNANERILCAMDDSVPIAALQHYLFCPRQCALIHNEQQWQENQYTAEGQLLHQRTDQPNTEQRRGVRTITAMPLNSWAFGIHGVADVVELRKDQLITLPYPVEYKRGKPKRHRADEVQLCAQALCLEEMFDTSITEGALFYSKNKRRQTIALDHTLRELTGDTILKTRSLLLSGTTPAVLVDRKPCCLCSMREICLPEVVTSRQSAARWLKRQLRE